MSDVPGFDPPGGHNSTNEEDEIPVPVPMEAFLSSGPAEAPAPHRTTIVPLRMGPLLVRTRNMSRWHRVRAAAVFRRDEAIGSLPAQYTVWALWCGQSAFSMHSMPCDRLPTDGVPICGTCEGRAMGAGRDGVVATVTAPADLLFTPTKVLTIPKVCPATVYREITWNRCECLLCGAFVKLRAGGGPYRSTWKPQRHGPQNMIPGCPLHAWSGMRLHPDGTVSCPCEQRPWTAQRE